MTGWLHVTRPVVPDLLGVPGPTFLLGVSNAEEGTPGPPLVRTPTTRSLLLKIRLRTGVSC